MTKKQSYYAVSVGKKPGVYLSWKDCRKQVKGVKNATFKKFSEVEKAKEFVIKNQTNITLTLKEVECSSSARLTKPPTIGVKRRVGDDNDDKAKTKKTKSQNYQNKRKSP